MCTTGMKVLFAQLHGTTSLVVIGAAARVAKTVRAAEAVVDLQSRIMIVSHHSARCSCGFWPSMVSGSSTGLMFGICISLLWHVPLRKPYFLLYKAFVFLFAALALRKRQSKAEILLEETAIRSAGIKKSHIPRIVLAVVVFILCLILFRRKILTWFFLCSANLAAMGYYFHLSKKKSVQSGAAYNAYNENMS